MFRRTNAGISNYRRFLKVDIKVFVEGKSDVNYWERVFSLYRPDLKLSFEDKRGCRNLSEIIDGICSGDISNVIVCRDRDYDFMYGHQCNHRNIVYTYGYSFENDFFTEESAAKLAAVLSVKPVSTELVRRAFRRYAANLRSTGEWLLKMDISYAVNGNPILARTNPRHLTCELKSRTLIFDRVEIAKVLSEVPPSALRAEIDFGPHSPVFPRYYCGHSLFFMFAEWCRAAARHFGGKLPNASDVLVKNFLFSHYHEVADPDARSWITAQLQTI